MILKDIRGYIFSRSFYGERVPQHVQNIIIRKYCQKYNLNFLLSSTEYAMDNCYMVLNSELSHLEKSNGLVFYSLFQLPIDIKQRHIIYKRIITKGKELHFAVEELSIDNILNAERVEDIIMVKNATIFQNLK